MNSTEVSFITLHALNCRLNLILPMGQKQDFHYTKQSFFLVNYFRLIIAFLQLNALGSIGGVHSQRYFEHEHRPFLPLHKSDEA